MVDEFCVGSAAPLKTARGHYPIMANVQYRLSERGKPAKSGSGCTISLSSAVIVFQAEEPLRPGAQIQLLIEWPAILNGSVGLRLCVTGTVIGDQTGCAAVRIQRYEFRTRSLARSSVKKPLARSVSSGAVIQSVQKRVRSVS